MGKNVIISLGECCEISSMHRYFNLSLGNGPFDWVAIYDSSTVTNMIQNDFKGVTQLGWCHHPYIDCKILQLKNYPVYIPEHSLSYVSRLAARIERFRQLLKDESINLLFVHKSHSKCPITREQAVSLFKVISKIRQGPFRLLVVNEYTSSSNVPEYIKLQYDVEDCRIIYRAVVGQQYHELGVDNSNPIHSCMFRELEKAWWLKTLTELNMIP